MNSLFFCWNKEERSEPNDTISERSITWEYVPGETTQREHRIAELDSRNRELETKIISLENQILNLKKRLERSYRINYWEVDSVISMDAIELREENSKLKLNIAEIEENWYQNQVQLVLKDIEIRKIKRLMQEKAIRITNLEGSLSHLQHFQRENNRLRKEILELKSNNQRLRELPTNKPTLMDLRNLNEEKVAGQTPLRRRGSSLMHLPTR